MCRYYYLQCRRCVWYVDIIIYSQCRRCVWYVDIIIYSVGDVCGM